MEWELVVRTTYQQQQNGSKTDNKQWRLQLRNTSQHLWYRHIKSSHVFSSTTTSRLLSGLYHHPYIKVRLKP